MQLWQQVQDIKSNPQIKYIDFFSFSVRIWQKSSYALHFVTLTHFCFERMQDGYKKGKFFLPLKKSQKA